MKMKVLEDLQLWYHSQCDEDWEHSFGVEIGTLDNPGWFIKIDLEDTILSGKEFPEMKYGSEHDDSLDWIVCKIEEAKFVGYGGPRKLEELITIFLDWAKTEDDWLAIPPPVSQEEQDIAWYNSLEVETGPDECRKEGCNTLTTSFSIFCRRHHFEEIKGRLPDD